MKIFSFLFISFSLYVSAELPEPYLPLNGGSFSGNPIPFHPDPLATYVWSSTVNASILQYYTMYPVTVSLTPDTHDGAIDNIDSLLTPNSTNVLVSGPGGIQIDFGVEGACWLEFESSSLLPVDLPAVTLSIGETNEYCITNLGPKVGVPVSYNLGNGVMMYRLEIPHTPVTDLYEGVRFAWIRFNTTPSVPFEITAFRAQCQIKPTNWGGSFEASGDPMLSKIWYTGAYTVKVNLLSDQFGSILIYRGDRFSWTGDAHVAQATAMAALGNYPFVLQNLLFTKDNCNGIESYCLYLCQSVYDYYMATNDTASILYLADYVNPKLEHAHDVWGTQVALGFYSWDDRAGSGFDAAHSQEAQAAYRHLAIWSWRQWATVLRSLGLTQNATHFDSYADNAITASRDNGNSPWYSSFGWFALTDAINGNWTTNDEIAEMIPLTFNDSTTICALSNFNTYFLLHALAIAGEFDRAIAVIHHCWDVQILLGATTTWETSKPDWDDFLSPNEPIPGFSDGFTSLAHPWASGATAWSSQYLLGVRPITPGFSEYKVAPHISETMTGVKGTYPLYSIKSKDNVRDINDEDNVIRVRATMKSNHSEAAIADICVQAAGKGRQGVLELSETLVSRLLQTSTLSLDNQVYISVVHTRRLALSKCECLEMDDNSKYIHPNLDDTTLVFKTISNSGPMNQETGKRSKIASLSLQEGMCTHVQLSYSSTKKQKSLFSPPNPFPPPKRNATFIGRDEITGGDWIGTYGSAGYFLVAFDGPNQHVSVLPSWVINITNPIGQAQNGPWYDPIPDHDRRALLDPRNTSAPRKIGQFSAPPPPADGWAPSLPFDMTVTDDAPEGFTYQFAFYFVDYDTRGRRQSVQLMDQLSKSDISPTQMVRDFVNGVWLVWQYPKGVRIRLNWIRGDNEVMSAILFDLIKTD